MENKDTLILFDVGAVLVSLDHESHYRKLSELSDLNHEEVIKRYTKSDLNQKFWSGLISTLDYFLLLRKLIGVRNDVTDETLMDAYVSKIGEQIGDVIRVKERLIKAGYSVGIFSNMEEVIRDYISLKFPRVLETQDGSPKILSFESGGIKPSERMYNRVNWHGRVIYIDDNSSYVQKGEERGWKGIVFTPFVDSKESVRLFQGSNGSSASSNILHANSIDELVKSLESFGLKF
ncbi:MAG: hypothetical protein ABIH49_00250 [archaeon]